MHRYNLTTATESIAKGTPDMVDMVTQSELIAALRGLIPLAEMSGADNRDPALREAKRVLAKVTPRTHRQT